MGTELERALAQLPSTAIYAAVGIAMFIVCFLIVARVAPFSVRKEIEEDQNVALAIIIGSMFLGVAYIIGSVIASP